MFCFTACGETIESELFDEELTNRKDTIIYNEKDVDTLIVAQWNIGHFSGGVSPNSTIEGIAYEQKKNDFTLLISMISADVLCLNEYSDYWGKDEKGKRHRANEDLFNSYLYSYVGHQSRYSCNALFSTIPLNDSKEIRYECNKTTNITHTNAIKATDYYLVETNISYKGNRILIVSTHLAFDNNNEDVALNQIKELISRYQEEEYIILCGDWNVKSVSAFDLFLEAGYQLGNHGKFGDIITFDASNYCLDNILTKGLDVVDFHAINSNLSDHKPVVASLVLRQ